MIVYARTWFCDRFVFHLNCLKSLNLEFLLSLKKIISKTSVLFIHAYIYMLMYACLFL